MTEQAPLWTDDDLLAARAEVEGTRHRWAEERRRHPIGSAEEIRAWEAYRTASDGYWQLLRERPF